MQRSPANLPRGMPGIGLVIEGAIQQAPQPDRHENVRLILGSPKRPLCEHRDTLGEQAQNDQISRLGHAGS